MSKKEKKDRSKEPKGKVVKQDVPVKEEAPKKPEAPKGSEAFKETIKAHLRTLAMKDPLFLKTLKKPNKNINDCITYIVNQVQASGSFGFPDSEIYQMAVHYYDEDDIKVGTPISEVHIVNNNAVMLTPEEIEKAKEKAREKVVSDEIARMKKKPEKKAVTIIPTPSKEKENVEGESPQEAQGSLF